MKISEEAAANIAERCFKDVKILVGPDIDEEAALKKMKQIATRCIEASWNFWCCKERIEVLALNDLLESSGTSGESASSLAFSSKSEVLALHGLNNADVYRNECALDGREVMLMFNPALVAVGYSKDGEEIESRVLQKAVVWVA